MTWNTFSSRVVSRPAIATISIRASQPAIHSAAIGLEGVRFIGGSVGLAAGAARGKGRPVSATPAGFATRKYAGRSDAVSPISIWECRRPNGAKESADLANSRSGRTC